MLNRLKTQEQTWNNHQRYQVNLPSKSPQKIHNQTYNTQPTFNLGQKQNLNLQRNISNKNIINRGAPLISPRKSQASQKIFPNNQPMRKSQNAHQQKYSTNQYQSRPNTNICSNHPNKKPQFILQTQQGQEYYCNRCAAQLATQGFSVHKISSSKNSLKMSVKNHLPHLPQYENEPIYQQIIEIIKLCNNVVSQHGSNIQKLGQIEQEYNNQIQMTTSFYDRLAQIIEEMKNDHLHDLADQRDKNTQAAQIQIDNLRQNIIQTNGIKNDIEEHLEEVMENIISSGDISQCKESLEQYRQRLSYFRHQNQIDAMSVQTKYTQSKIQSMTRNFQEFLSSMWDEQPQHHYQEQRLPERNHTEKTTKNMNSAMTVKNIHQFLPKANNKQNGQIRDAFRNLQAEEEDLIPQKKSPNFKRF